MSSEFGAREPALRRVELRGLPLRRPRRYPRRVPDDRGSPLARGPLAGDDVSRLPATAVVLGALVLGALGGALAGLLRSPRPSGGTR